MAKEHSSAFLLCKALRQQNPPIFISDGVAKQWLKKYYGDVKTIHNAGHLELQFGQCIRDRPESPFSNGSELQVWMLQQHKISVEARVCQHWLSTEWSTSDNLLTIAMVESRIGDRMRLSEYRDCFNDDVVATTLSQQ